MKKKMLSLATALLFVIAMATGAMAGTTVVNATVGGSATVNTGWSGTNGDIQVNGMYLNPNLSTGATVAVYNGGATYAGSANFVNLGDNPYSYGVNSTKTSVGAAFTGAGVASLDLNRTSSYASYGPAGQGVSLFVVSDATGQLAANVNTNYANMTMADYGQPRTTGGKEIEATGNFNLGLAVFNGLTGASIINTGSGSSQLSAMSNQAGGALGGDSWRFGRGAGCYTDAKIIATGTGTVMQSAGAGNGLTVWAGPYNNEVNYVVPGNGTAGSASYNLTIGYAGNFTLPNFSLSGR